MASWQLEIGLQIVKGLMALWLQMLGQNSHMERNMKGNMRKDLEL